MGQAKAKRAVRDQFFVDHPFCCFCGGVAPATTQDHFPPRSLFRERKWPEGYLFPACERCNSATRKDELLLGLIFRFSNPNPTELDNKEFQSKLRNVQNNFPGILETMKLYASEKRHALKRFDIPRLPGQSIHEFPIVRYPEITQPAIKRFLFKMGCALHYFHTGKPLGADSQVLYEFRTNAMLHKYKLPAEILKAAPSLATLSRANQPLEDQFSYRFGVVKDAKLAAFLCVFWASSIATIITIGDPQVFEAELEIDTNQKLIRVGGFLANVAG